MTSNRRRRNNWRTSCNKNHVNTYINDERNGYVQTPFEAGLGGLKLDGESEGEIEGAFENARDLGDPISQLLSPSPYRLSGSGG
jgi:hypothetical protein